VQRLRSQTLATKELAVASWQCTVSHFLFHQEFLTKNTMTVVPHQLYLLDLAPWDFSLFSWLKIKLKGCCFDTIEVIEAESHAVLNTLTEHDFQDAFKKWQKHWEWCGRWLLQGLWWPVGPKLVFYQMVAPVPEIMDTTT
jgi:hypothetical protein